MPRFLEQKLKKEYGADSSVPYKIMNSMGVMRGSKETAKGRVMEKKHAKSKALNLKTGKGMAWRRKDFNKDTRTAFMKALDQHKVDRLKYK